MKYQIYMLVLFSTLTQCAEYKNAQECLQAITSAHVKAFSVDNLLTEGMPQGGEQDWNGALKGVDTWISQTLSKPRSIVGEISAKNRELIQKALANIRAASNDLITTIKTLRNANFNFEQNHYADIDLDAVKLQVGQLIQRADVLKQLQKSLEPGFLDVQDTKNIKKLLKDISLILEQTFLKVGKDLDKLRAPIRYAIDQKKYGR